jgi:hypothetical protein
MHSRKARALHRSDKRWMPFRGCPMPTRAVKAKCRGQGAVDSTPPQVGFCRRARDRLGFTPKPPCLCCLALGFGPLFPFALGKRCCIRGRVIAKSKPRRRKNVEKSACGFLAVQHQPPISDIWHSNLSR